MDRALRLICAACGLLAPAILIGAVAFAGSNTPEYSQVDDAVSELGMIGAPQALTMNFLGFGLVGLLIALFTPGLHRSINRGQGSRMGPGLLSISGIAWAALGLTPGNLADPASITWHAVLVGCSFVAGGLGLLMLVGRLGEDPHWSGLGNLTALVGLITMGFLFTGEMSSYPGLVQRGLAAVYFVWIGILALHSLRSPVPAHRTAESVAS